jgi:predicted enzyme related to lactoylglutathione lyase
MARFDMQVNLDSTDPESLMAFWVAVLGYERRGSAGPYLSASDPDGIGPRLVIQRVPEPRTAKNRMHLDLYANSPSEWHDEIERVTGLGATVVSEAPMELDDDHWLVLADPEGNEFCICYDGSTA